MGIHNSGAKWVATFDKEGQRKVDIISHGNVNCDQVALVAQGRGEVLSDERKPGGDCQPVSNELNTRG